MDNIYKTTRARITRIRKHTPTEWSFVLEYKVDNEPGKFVMVSLPGTGEAPISISGFGPDHIELTIRNVGEVTSGLFKLKAGEYFEIRGPYGNTFQADSFLGKHLLVIAGGSGVAAIKPVVEYFHGRGTCTLKQLDVLVGFRSPTAMIFKDELRSWSKWSKQCNVILTVDSDEDEEEQWQGGIGFAMSFIKHVENVGENTSCIVVGPPRMMTNTVRELFNFNIKPENIWLSFERHMKCGVGKCGHCRVRDKYVCTDGPVFNYNEVKELID